jgi:hypothetical protein
MARAALAGLLAAAAGVFAHGAAVAAPFAVVLRQPPPLFKGAKSMPRITSPATAATAKINTDLAKVDSAWMAEARDCRETAGGAEVDLGRDYAMKMRGPAYFALEISDEEFCGGAHPSTTLTPITYDLATGERIDWLKVFPASARVKRSFEADPGEPPVDEFRSPVLHALYLKKARAARSAADWKDCAEALQDPELDFQMVPDAEQGALEITPDLPHAVMACGDSVALSPADMRALGVAQPLVEAIGQSHAAWLAWKKAHPEKR